MSFYKNQLSIFLGATLADMSTGVILNGLNGEGKPINWGNSLLGGLQTGTNFVAYSISVDLLEKNCKKYKELKEQFDDPKKSAFSVKSKFYLINAFTTAGLITAINYPLSKVQEKFQNSKENSQPCSIVNFYVDRVLPNVGYPAVANYLTAKIPDSKNSLLQYLRKTNINLGGCLGGSIYNLPVSVFRDHIPVLDTLKGFCGAILPVVCTQDCLGHYLNVLKSISE